MTIPELADELHAAYGDLDWWPGESPFEVAVGAVLTQNTAWRNVERAIARLREAAALSPPALAAAAPETIQEWIRPAGYFRQKTLKLQRLTAWWRERLGDDPAAQPADTIGLEELRLELLDITGVGPETADSILLYGFGRPSFVVDAYTARLCTRLGILDGPTDYHELQARFTDDLPRDEGLYNRLHAQIVRHMQDPCSKRRPACDRCMLADRCLGPVDLAP